MAPGERPRTAPTSCYELHEEPPCQDEQNGGANTDCDNLPASLTPIRVPDEEILMPTYAYTLLYLPQKDIIAGLSVGFMVVPQGMA